MKENGSSNGLASFLIEGKEDGAVAGRDDMLMKVLKEAPGLGGQSVALAGKAM